MCAINGFTWEDKALITRMDRVLKHRGPDDTGIYLDKGISLGHNRLSIIDLSKKGHQPMSDREGTLTIVYNGEIYNFKDIRRELEKKGYSFASGSDTETLLYAYKEYGSSCLQMLNGMFAFAVWDSEKKELFLARDRLGIKPLYYHHDDNDLIFSSELKAILEHDIDRVLDSKSLSSFLTYRFIADDNTMLKGIKKLPPGHHLLYKDGKVRISRYWSLDWTVKKKSLAHYTKKTGDLLKDAVEKRLLSDVPLGVFLSGGLDSSLITAINTKLRDEPVKTFSVGFGHESDELSWASKVAGELSTDHKEILLDYGTLTRSIPDIVWHMDEPHTDPTMFPLYFLAEEARKDVTVINTGEGADELFSGYLHYKAGSPKLGLVPSVLRKKAYSYYYQPFKPDERRRLLGTKTQKARVLDNYLSREGDMLNNILAFDIDHELPNWQLTRVDRMTMAHGMEARVPFLDHRMVELASGMPPGFKQHGLIGKHVLKEASQAYLPKEIIYRKKQGFTTPLHAWAKDSLADYAQSAIRDMPSGIFNKRFVDRLAENNRSDKQMFARKSYQLMIIALFSSWHGQYIERS